MTRLFMIVGLFVHCAAGAAAESSLGVTGLEVGVAGISPSDGGSSISADITLDVAVSEFHGIQGELAWIETPNGAVGRVGGHLYMEPRLGQKYGFFATIGDVNDRALTYAAGGVEGMFELSDSFALGGYAGAGMGSQDGLDVIFGGLEATYVASETLRLDGGVQLTEYDEIGFQAVGALASLNMRYSPEGQPISVTAGLVHDVLSGRDGAPAVTRAEIKLSVRLGTINGREPTDRPFRTPDPFLPLVQRGLY
ncbi:MAG: hypothetical protein AAGO57_01095 [Pseudomonadota bacterium]